MAKGQLISKAIYGLPTSPKKRMDEFVLFAFLLFTANKSNSSVHFLGESTARQSAFCFHLTFTLDLLFESDSAMLPNCPNFEVTQGGPSKRPSIFKTSAFFKGGGRGLKFT